MTEALVTVPGEYTPKQKEIMLETVARGCKPEQFMLMMELAKKYKLDPFARQIWATPMGIIIGRDGFLTLAHNSGNFDGMDTEFIERNEKLHAAKCTVWHKRMSHPITFTAKLDEFFKPGSDAWRKMPYVMLQKCAESHALRRAFSVTGLYDEAELCDDPTVPEENPPVMDFTATVNGEPASVQPMRKPLPKCTCGEKPMDEFTREKYEGIFTRAGMELPPNICKKCADLMWKARPPTPDPQDPYGMKPTNAPAVAARERPPTPEPEIIDYHGKKVVCVCKKCGARLNKNLVAARLIFNEDHFVCKKCDPEKGL